MIAYVCMYVCVYVYVCMYVGENYTEKCMYVLYMHTCVHLVKYDEYMNVYMLTFLAGLFHREPFAFE